MRPWAAAAAWELVAAGDAGSGITDPTRVNLPFFSPDRRNACAKLQAAAHEGRICLISPTHFRHFVRMATTPRRAGWSRCARSTSVGSHSTLPFPFAMRSSQ